MRNWYSSHAFYELTSRHDLFFVGCYRYSTVYGGFTAFFRSLINWHQCGENVAILVFHVHFPRKISSPSNSQERKIWGRCIGIALRLQFFIRFLQILFQQLFLIAIAFSLIMHFLTNAVVCECTFYNSDS